MKKLKQMKGGLTQMDKHVQMTSYIVGTIVLVAVLAFIAVLQFAPTTSANTVQVQGTATIKVMPDVISVYVNAESRGKTSAEASDKNTQIVEAFKRSMRAQGFTDAEIQTASFNIYPDYTWNDGVQKQNGFVATQGFKIVLNESRFDKVSEVVDSAVSAGAGISYINFELSEEKQSLYKKEALQKAAVDAKEKAVAVASGFGKTISAKPIEISVSDFGYMPWNRYEASASGGIADAKQVAANLVPSEQDVTAYVSARYALR